MERTNNTTPDVPAIAALRDKYELKTTVEELDELIYALETVGSPPSELPFKSAHDAILAHELRAALLDAAERCQWRPIETVPEGHVLLYSPGDLEDTGYLPFIAVENSVNRHGEVDCPRDTRFEDGCYPTHWMPLPAAPDSDAGQETAV